VLRTVLELSPQHSFEIFGRPGAVEMPLHREPPRSHVIRDAEASRITEDFVFRTTPRYSACHACRSGVAGGTIDPRSAEWAHCILRDPIRSIRQLPQAVCRM
jgi:hypothetical protein